MSSTASSASALRGDLDAILTQALAADPQHRYTSVDALASDLNAWLRHRPLQARRANGWTRATKFVHRNRIACGLALAAILASAAGFATYVASNYAERQHAAELQAVTKFQANMLQKIVPQEVGAHLRNALASELQEHTPSNNAVTAVIARIDYTGMAVGMLDEALLKRALQAARKEFANQPRVQAMLLQTLANSYRDLDMLDTAEPIQEQATALFLTSLGASDPQTLSSLRDQLELLRARALGGALGDGEARHREVLREHVRYLGEDSVDTALAREALGQWLMSHGKAVEAEKLLRAAAASIENSNGHDDRDAVAARANLAYAIDAQGRYAEAVPYYLQSIADMSRLYGPEHRDTLVHEGNLAYVLDMLGRTDEAEALLRKVYEANSSRLGDDHLLTVNSLNNLAVTMGKSGDLASAEPVQKRAFEDSRRVLGADHTIALAAQTNLAHVYFKLGRFDDAKVLLIDVIERWKPHRDRLSIIQCQRQLGKTFQALGQPEPALQALTESWEIATEINNRVEQRKSAQALVAFYTDPDGDSKRREHWEAKLRTLELEPALSSR